MISEYGRRRNKLCKQLGKDSIVLLPSADEQVRSNDTDYPFCQNSDFFYLSGFEEPESLIALLPGRKEGSFVMFNRERNEAEEMWHGRRYGQEGVVEQFDVDQAFPIDDVDELLPELLVGRDKIYYALGAHNIDARVLEWVDSYKRQARMQRRSQPVLQLLDLAPILHEQRLRKSAHEVRQMRKAARISAKAHERAMVATEPGKTEMQIEGELRYSCMQEGAKEQAYTPIVASGDNACILHYTENNAVLKDGDLLLIDAGCEFGHYASDITRTFPVNGRFNEAQRIIYQIVLDAQLAAIEQVRPGKPWSAIHEAAVKVITQGLIHTGLLKGSVEQLIKKQAYRQFYMHNTGHWLGLDVHDVGEYQSNGKPRKLEPGMVLTVEPGIYIAPTTRRVARKWLGIGVRIEDDVLVTPKGCEVLTKDAPKTIDEIEALMAKVP